MWLGGELKSGDSGLSGGTARTTTHAPEARLCERGPFLLSNTHGHRGNRPWLMGKGKVQAPCERDQADTSEGTARPLAF